MCQQKVSYIITSVLLIDCKLQARDILRENMLICLWL